jgi:hypothetical protein
MVLGAAAACGGVADVVASAAAAAVVDAVTAVQLLDAHQKVPGAGYAAGVAVRTLHGLQHCLQLHWMLQLLLQLVVDGVLHLDCTLHQALARRD